MENKSESELAHRQTPVLRAVHDHWTASLAQVVCCNSTVSSADLDGTAAPENRRTGALYLAAISCLVRGGLTLDFSTCFCSPLPVEVCVWAHVSAFFPSLSRSLSQDLGCDTPLLLCNVRTATLVCLVDFGRKHKRSSVCARPSQRIVASKLRWHFTRAHCIEKEVASSRTHCLRCFQWQLALGVNFCYTSAHSETRVSELND